jgi:hypothetical protein
MTGRQNGAWKKPPIPVRYRVVPSVAYLPPAWVADAWARRN